jgi:hypothetical protein
MLRHGLQGFQGVEVATPRAVALKPRAKFLAERYELFRRASGGESRGRRWPVGNTWVTDMRHFLDEARAIPDDLPGPARSLALFLGAIVAWVTSGRSATEPRTNVPCRRNPKRRRCAGEILAAFEADGSTISWQCPVCKDNGVTRGWEGTPWDRRPAAAEGR